MAKGIGPLFGLEVDEERKNLFGTVAKAKELGTAFVAEGCKVVIFELLTQRSKLGIQRRQTKNL